MKRRAGRGPWVALALVAASVTGAARAEEAPCTSAAVVVEGRGAALDPEVLPELALAMGDAGIDAIPAPAGGAGEAAAPIDPCAPRLRVSFAGGGEGRGLLRVELARPGTAVLLVREEEVEARAVLARSVVLARDVLGAAAALPTGAAVGPRPAAAASPLDAPAPPPRDDDGTLPFAVGGATIGTFTGLGVYLATGADDSRILYPMLATGAGVGLGGALLVAGEWDVTDADAWFVIAGGTWPTAAAHLIYEGRFADSRGSSADQERWSYGLVGTTAGLGLTTLAIALRRPTDGDAALVHSGAAYGAAMGGLAEYGVRGVIGGVPEAGLGYGAAIGWLAAGTLSLSIDIEPGDVLALDLGATLGGLGGAALASPLVFDDPEPTAQRAFVAVAAGSTLVGAGIGWWLTRDAAGERSARRVREAFDELGGPGQPSIGVLGESVVGSRRAPIYGGSYSLVLP